MHVNYNGDYIDDYLSTTIPLYSIMGIHVESYDLDSLVMTAPLAPNINDKGTGFGGSIYSLAVLAGWAFVALGLRNSGLANQVVIHKSEMKYMKPIQGDFSAESRVGEGESMNEFVNKVKTSGKGSLGVYTEIKEGNEVAAIFQGTYFAIQ
jgi:thioesterase domain-containing protein